MDELFMIKRGDHVRIFHVHKLERGGKYTLPIYRQEVPRRQEWWYTNHPCVCKSPCYTQKIETRLSTVKRLRRIHTTKDWDRLSTKDWDASTPTIILGTTLKNTENTIYSNSPEKLQPKNMGVLLHNTIVCEFLLHNQNTWRRHD